MAWPIAAGRFISFQDGQDSPFNVRLPSGLCPPAKFMTKGDIGYFLNCNMANLAGFIDSQYVPAGLLSSGAVYQSAAYSESATRNNCGIESNPTTITLTSPLGQFNSSTNQATANALAVNWVQANKQAYANSYGQCILRAVAWRGIAPYCIQSTAPVLLKVGDAYQGGIIGYILGSNDVGYDDAVQHGIIAAPSDQALAMVWWNGSNVNTYMVDGDHLMQGYITTANVVSIQGAGSNAASLCWNLTLNGFSDWALPSALELYQLRANRGLIGNFADLVYWSCSERYGHTDQVHTMDFATGYTARFTLKNQLGRVRAVRYF